MINSHIGLGVLSQSKNESTLGRVWEYATVETTLNDQLFNFNTIAYGNGVYLAGGLKSATPYYYARSTDGYNWTINTGNRASDIIYGNLRTYGDGFFSTNQYESSFFRSHDGLTWERTTLSYNNGWNSLVSSSNGINLFGFSGTSNQLATNNDSRFAFTYSTLPTGQWYSCASNGTGTIIAASINNNNNKAIISSINGSSYTLRNTPANHSYTSICYGNGWYVAVGNYGVIARSRDGITWYDVSLPNNVNNIQSDIAYGNGIFVITRYSYLEHQIAISTNDGLTWEEIYIDLTPDSPRRRFDLKSICFDGEKFVAIGNQLLEYVNKKYIALVSK